MMSGVELVARYSGFIFMRMNWLQNCYTVVLPTASSISDQFGSLINIHIAVHITYHPTNSQAEWTTAVVVVVCGKG